MHTLSAGCKLFLVLFLWVNLHQKEGEKQRLTGVNFQGNPGGQLCFDFPILQHVIKGLRRCCKKMGPLPFTEL